MPITHFFNLTFGSNVFCGLSYMFISFRMHGLTVLKIIQCIWDDLLQMILRRMMIVGTKNQWMNFLKKILESERGVLLTSFNQEKR